MLVVVGVIVLLAGFVVSLTLRMDNQGKERELAGVFVLLKSALIAYYDDTGGFPVPDPDVRDEDFDEAVERGELMYARLVSIPASRQILKQVNASYVKGDGSVDDPLNVHDAWGTPLDYVYDPNTRNFPELISAGPDETFDTADDISSKRR
jgi:type II secretory pathway pseudopilin PulG